MKEGFRITAEMERKVVAQEHKAQKHFPFVLSPSKDQAGSGAPQRQSYPAHRWALKKTPFVLSPSKDPNHHHMSPFDKLRANGSSR